MIYKVIFLVCFLLLSQAVYSNGTGGAREMSDKPALRLRGKDVPVDVRRIITGYDSPAALIDVGGELFAGGNGTVLTLRPFDETCKIESVDSENNVVVIHHPGYATPKAVLKMTPHAEPALDWATVYSGLSASLTATQLEYGFGSKVLVNFTLKNESHNELILEMGWRRKPHFWFFMSHSRTGVAKVPPSLDFDRLFDFEYGKGPVNPVKLLPGRSISVELDLNQFLAHEVGTPESMGRVPIGSVPANYEVVGVYQQLKHDNKDMWFGSVTSNKINFRLLPKGKESTEAEQSTPADADKTSH